MDTLALYKKKKHTKCSGFSLIEVLVSLALFAIVVTMSVGTLIVLIDANAKAQNVQILVNSVAMTVDSMVRDIRTGFNYRCDANINVNTPADCLAGGTTFSFSESGGSLTGDLSSDRIGYRMVGGRIQRNLIGTVGSVANNWADMTPAEVTITEMTFFVNHTSRADDRSPTVFIVIKGQAGNMAGTDSSFIIQTAVTQQLIDI